MPQEWNVGDKLANRWEIRKVMKGGMGVVYVVYDHEWQEVQAAKTFQDKVFADDPLLALMFTQEAQAWVDLAAHPNVARAEFVQEIEGKPVLFLEYVSGGDLSRWIGTPRLTGRPAEAVRLALEFCDGMAHLRVRGIEAHRDIKPQNCLLTETGRLKITDFGLAKVAEDLVRGAAGTATHMPPEQFMNAKSVGVAADVYSFGVMLFQMLTGRLPFAGESWEDFEMAHMFQLPPVEQIEHAGLRAVVGKCLDKQAEARYENFVLLRGELEGIYRELTGNAAPAPAAAIPVESDPGHWANKGFSLLALGKADRAKECFGKALELDGKSAAANVGLGNVWLAKGEPGWALDYYKASVEADSEFALGWYSVAVGLEVVKPHEEWAAEALRAVDRALELDPGLAMAWSTKGVVLRGMDRDGQAEECFRKALELDPRLGAGWSNLGSLWMDRCQYEEAVRCQDKAVEFLPESGDAWFNRGNALVLAQRLEDGETSYRKAVELDPGLADAWYALARVMERQKGREADAAAAYGSYLELRPKDGAKWMLLGELRDKLGDKEGAYAAFGKACEAEPGLAKAQHNRGMLANELGRGEEALAAFEAAWAVTKSEPETGLARGNVLGAMGRVDEALAAYEELLAAHPKFERGWFSKGATLGNAKRYEEALECFEKAGELGHPKAMAAAENCRKALAAAAPPVLTARDWHNKGADLAETGKADEALVCFDKALELSPGAPETLFGKGVALGQLGRMEEALDCMEKVCAAAPDFWVAWSRRGLALQALDRPEEAVACYEEAMRRGGSGLEPMIAECRAAAERRADWKGKGLALAGEGKWDEALGCFEKALEKTPGAADLLLEKGKALEELGRKEEALSAYMAACAADSDNGTAWLRRGMVLQALERWEPAIASYEEAAHLGGTGVTELIRQCRTELDRGVDWMARGASMVEEGKWAEALACYDKGLSLEPGSALFLAEKGLALDELGRHEEALEVLEDACEADPGYWVPWFRRGSVLQMKLGRYDEAIRCYEKAGEAGYAGAGELIAICRRQTPAGLMADWMEKGEVLLAEGNAEDAVVAFAAAGDADPQAGQPWLRRGTVLRSPLRRYAEAVESLEKAAALGCGEGTALAAACRTEWKDEVNRLRSKSVEAALGLKTEEALAASDEALRLDPGSAEVWLARALVMSKLDRPAERLEALEKAVSLDAGNGFAWMMKAIAEGATPAGLASAEQAEKLGNPKGKELAARYRRELGDGVAPAAPAAPVTFAAPAVAAVEAAPPPPPPLGDDAPFSGTLPAFRAPVVADDAPFSGTLPAFRAPVVEGDAPFSGTLPAFQAPVLGGGDAPFSGTLPAFQAPSFAAPPPSFAPPPPAFEPPPMPAGPPPEELFGKGMEQLGANGNLGEALRYFEQAAAARPEYCEAWWGKGIVLAQFGQNEAAVEAFDRALGVNPRYGAAWMSKGAIFANLGRFAEALPFYEQAKQLGEPAADFAIAECQRAMGTSWPPAWG